MSIFRRDEPASTPARPIMSQRSSPPSGDPSRRSTLVAQGTKIEGCISGSCEVLVEGLVEGEVRLSGQLTIGAGGEVVGNVSARSVRIAGRLNGNVTAVDRIELMPTGAIEGDVTAPRVAIAEGGFCKGKIEMNPQPAKAPTGSPISGSARASSAGIAAKRT